MQIAAISVVFSATFRRCMYGREAGLFIGVEQLIHGKCPLVRLSTAGGRLDLGTKLWQLPSFVSTWLGANTYSYLVFGSRNILSYLIVYLKFPIIMLCTAAWEFNRPREIIIFAFASLHMHLFDIKNTIPSQNPYRMSIAVIEKTSERTAFHYNLTHNVLLLSSCFMLSGLSEAQTSIHRRSVSEASCSKIYVEWRLGQHLVINLLLTA